MAEAPSTSLETSKPLDPRGASAQPPEAPVPLGTRAPSAVAGGIPAIVQSMKFALGEAGLVRGTRLLARLNQMDGYDCPGCAWPDPDGHRSAFEFCENGAKAVAEEGTKARITAEFFARHSVAQLSQQSDHWLGQQGRLTQPMLLEPGETHYRPLSWDQAFARIGSELRGLASPDQAVFYTSGRASNEAAFLYQLFIREFGTNNLPDCSNMCHESSGNGLMETIGIGKGTVKLDDFEKAQVILIAGQNPGTNHPRMLTALQAAKRAGAKIISVNPLREAGLLAFKHPQEALRLLGPGTQLSDLFLQVRINGDVALFQGLGKCIVEAGAVDEGFIRERTQGYAALADHLRELNWADLEAGCGIAEAQIRAAAKLLIENERIIVCWAMGLTQHQNAVDNVREVVNLLLLRGSIGKPGAGVCPVRGHSNVQGDRTMGIYEKPSPAFLDALDKATGIVSPRAHGLDTVDAIHALNAGKAKVFFALGGNFLSATPDTEYTAAGLRSARLTAHVSTKLNRSHLVTGAAALILPCLGRTEEDAGRFVTTENSMGVVQRSRGRVPPASEHLLSEPEIVARLAEATLGARSKVRYRWLAEDYDRIRDLIAQVVPGAAGYNARVRERGGFYLPNDPRDGIFPTETGRAKFTVHPLPKHALRPGQLLMMTVRSHDQYNTTIYGLEDRYRGLKGDRRVVLVNAEDLREQGLKDGETVNITSHFSPPGEGTAQGTRPEGSSQGTGDREELRTVRRFTVVAYDIPRGCACTYFPETNALVPSRHVAHTSNTPASKSVVITLEKA